MTTLAFCLLFLTGLLRDLPKAVLAAIVLMAVTGLINVPELRRVWRVSRLEFQVAMVALVGVLLLGILSVADLVENFQQQTKGTEAKIAPGLNPLLGKRLD